MMLVGCAGPQISNSVYEPPMPVGPVVHLPMQRHVEPLYSPKGAEQAEALAVHMGGHGQSAELMDGTHHIFER